MITSHTGSARPFIIAIVSLFAILIVLLSVRVIETGNVGVVKTLGEVSPDELGSGIHLINPLITSLDVYSAKEIQVDLEDMTPKASDNLSLEDFDITIYYQVAPDRIADMKIKYALPERGDGDILYPVYELVRKQSRSATYDAIAKIPSLDIHKQRQGLESDIMASIQKTLDESDPGVFTISRAIIRSIRTDRSVEKAIQDAVSAEKKLQAKAIQVDIANKDAEIEIARARGVAEANRIINDSLTPEYLQHELNSALMEFAKNGNGSVVIPANIGNVQMLLPTEKLGSARRNQSRK